jgi:hypothetical protein
MSAAQIAPAPSGGVVILRTGRVWGGVKTLCKRIVFCGKEDATEDDLKQAESERGAQYPDAITS